MVIGKMKDEVKGKVIGKFVGLKLNMCSLVSVNNEKNNQIKFYRIGNCDVCKISLSCFDDRKYILNVGINSLVYFHKDVNSQEN